MANSAVIVLTPNGRRQTIKVQPSTTVLQILEDVCKKHNFPVQEYDLKHHKRVLDLTMMFRFTGLPNNAQLEMVEAIKKRLDPNTTEVVLGLQLENGTRFQGSFKPTASILDVLKSLCPAECLTEHAVVVYMRKEIFGESLHSTTLKSLGLTNGRAIMRYLVRNPDILKEQANVSSPLLPKPSDKPLEESKIETKRQMTGDVVGASTDNNELIVPKPEPMEIEHEPLITSETLVTNIDSNSVPSSSQSQECEIRTINPISSKRDGATNIAPITEPESSDIEEDEPEIIILGDRNAVLFSLETSSRVAYDDIPDSFFDLTVHDVRVLLRDLKKESENLEEAPMLTSKMRELEENKKVLSRMNSYKKAVLRIKFPDHLVLQGTFNPVDTVGAVIDFVRPYLNDPQMDFHLFLTPPKTILSSDSHLVEAGCVPTALMHFGTEKKLDANAKVLRKDLQNKLSTPSAALLAASKSRNVKVTKSGPPSGGHVLGHGPASEKGAVAKSNSSTGTSRNSVDGKNMPKWFKPTGK